MTQTPVRGSKPAQRSNLSPLIESQKNMERLRRRRLFLGSVSSLSFEEEENDFYHCEAEERPISPISRCLGSSGSELSQRSGSTDSSSSSVATRSSPSNQSLEVSVRSPVAHLRHFELHEFLTDRLEEQVAYLIRVSHQERGGLAFVGLHTTLTEAVHDILHMSEDEPYGVRGATVILKMREQTNGRESERSLGVIAVDNNMVSTFRLTLILKEEKRLGVTFKNWLVEQFTGGKKELVISGQYEVRKEQLYRSSSGSRLAQFHL
ncbi:hypothetical protein TCAL_05934 [Tigriopus californicus]|uniref:Uncharacterized protein n=1 Tax=Tigriopus californicus TaxID=6832 RepID=A0A553NZR7_TIGCA|nr:uncharacterized protein LOC131886554 [Tigriopus californicus]TRY70939.1 hypothetical protein TCAL_05934 [Tigriopus californicus]|eukprot:TCALIF_05934-PA protein Name:"Similar to DDIT4L DNA damage-inducible transcript 4-like protein (Homo sapiens)" AED:0.19 eAED:0.19 QI:1/1/1/1/0.66/0.5/4/560/263